MNFTPKNKLVLSLAGFLSAGTLLAQQDAPPVDVSALLQALRGIKGQQVQQAKAAKQKALQQVQSSAASPGAAAASWEEAVRAAQFAGAAKEGSQYKEWREREGEALKEKEAANAAQLHFKWMALTLQRSIGTPIKEMLPQIVAYTKEVAADELAMDALEENIKRDREIANSNKHGKERKTNDEAVKKMHDQILKAPVNGSVAAQVLKITDLMNVDKWEMNAGSVDGIYSHIILPELRALRDPRLLEYWDMKLKHDADAATRTKLAFETEKYNLIRRPELLWSRALDLIVLGQRNRGLGEMFNLVKTYPNHPNADDWVTAIEQTLAPPAATDAADAPLAPPPAAK